MNRTVMALATAALMAFAHPGMAEPAAADIEASRAEAELLVFTNLSANQWEPNVKAFNATYPWIDVSIVDLGSSVFERYYADSASGVRTGDMIVAGGADNWENFSAKGGIAAFAAPAGETLPEWSKPIAGVYTYSADPTVMIYNKALIGDVKPASLLQLADMVAKDPSLANRISMPTAHAPFGRGATYALVEKDPAMWDVLDVLGPVTRVERTVGPVIEKVASGEYVVGYFISGAALFSRLKNPAFSSIVGWSYPQDITPVVPRLMAVTSAAKSPASARLMVDFLLTPAGQTAIGTGGATPYVEGIDKAVITGVTFQDVVAGAGGEDKIAFDPPGSATPEQRQQFLDRWNAKFSNKN